MITKKHGGKRKGAGRKKLADPKRAVTLYIHQSEINKSGGVEFLKQRIYTLLK